MNYTVAATTRISVSLNVGVFNRWKLPLCVSGAVSVLVVVGSKSFAGKLPSCEQPQRQPQQQQLLGNMLILVWFTGIASPAWRGCDERFWLAGRSLIHVSLVILPLRHSPWDPKESAVFHSFEFTSMSYSAVAVWTCLEYFTTIYGGLGIRGRKVTRVKQPDTTLTHGDRATVPFQNLLHRLPNRQKHLNASEHTITDRFNNRNLPSVLLEWI